MKNALTILFFLLVHFLFAQPYDFPIYIVKSNGDTIKGRTDRDYRVFPSYKKIKYFDSKKKKIKIRANGYKCFVLEGTVFEVIKVKPSPSPIATNMYFMQKIIDGQISTYSLQRTKYRFTLPLRGGGALKCVEYIYVKKKDNLYAIPAFKKKCDDKFALSIRITLQPPNTKKILKMFSDYPELQERIKKDKKESRRNIQQLVLEYNSFIDQKEAK